MVLAGMELVFTNTPVAGSATHAIGIPLKAPAPQLTRLPPLSRSGHSCRFVSVPLQFDSSARGSATISLMRPEVIPPGTNAFWPGSRGTLDGKLAAPSPSCRQATVTLSGLRGAHIRRQDPSTKSSGLPVTHAPTVSWSISRMSPSAAQTQHMHKLERIPQLDWYTGAGRKCRRLWQCRRCRLTALLSSLRWSDGQCMVSRLIRSYVTKVSVRRTRVQTCTKMLDSMM